MSPEQEPKYDAIDGKIVNRVSGQAIPDDEPVFVIRARDRHALMALRFYRDLCQDTGHIDFVEKRIVQFSNFKLNHPDRMKEPDSP
jgi:hypothetical protein